MRISSVRSHLCVGALRTALVSTCLVALANPSFAADTDQRKTGSVGSYSSSTTLSAAAGAGGLGDVRPASSTLKNGLKALGRRDMKSALNARQALRPGSLERKVMAWAIAIDGRDVPAQTMMRISNDLADWPGAEAMRENLERNLVKSMDGSALRVAFSQSAPETAEAAIAVARAHLAAGNRKSARDAIADHWRNSVLTAGQEQTVLKRLGPVLTKDDHRARVEYLLSRNRIRGATRIAGLAGATRMIRARAAVERKQSSAKKLLAAVPAFQKADPNYLFSRARYLRRKGDLKGAAKVLLSVDASKVQPNAGDGLWIEQRILASDLLEGKDSRTAYKLASRNVARSTTKRQDAEFYAGWLALRKRNAPSVAARHFERLLQIAGTPLSKSRGHYWLGRALSAAGKKGDAVAHYKAAARHDTTYYGQLAALRLGRETIGISRPKPTDEDRRRFERYEITQAIAKLESAGHPRWARMFYRHLARYLKTPGELALLAARAERKGDYQLSLQVGKRAFVRGFDVDTLAWPVGAIPRNTKTSGAGLPMAYAVARQESTFQVDARSPANALGLLQLLPATARSTARSIGMPYSRTRLTSDASYNARLGTAYFKKQMDSFGGSFIITLAAYNAGPSRAQDWIRRFGDPRGKSLDFVVDWIEQIPFSETRNYVQRVMENYQVYKTRLKGGRLTLDRDLRAGRR